MSGIHVLAIALFEAYSRNSGNPPDAHFERRAAEQWMAQALEECGVSKLIEAAGDGTPQAGDRAVSAGLWFGPHRAERLRAALARVTGSAA
ncbi:hypothetical protein [Luteimonas fraxinea]|uniref:Uncharacterized protein n=1 Tax=Luteimonas fraxinea TaxID=2901869 RepID=A0ABS8U9I9_9GAMM|nr:hypothetical protein [Luteimonas fraxinea]MCD9096158.1 hypothetical protein [Luteimonas fraxinea]